MLQFCLTITYTILSMLGLANILHSYGYIKKEIELHEKIIEASKKLYGETDEKTIFYMQRLGDVLDKEKLFTKKLNIMQQIFDILKKKYKGDDNIEITRAMENLASSFEDINDYENSLTIRKKIVDFYKKNNDKDNLIWSLKLLSYVPNHMNKNQEQLDVKQQILKMCEELKKEIDWNNTRNIENITQIYGNLGEYQEQLSIEKQILKIYRESKGENHEHTINAMENIAKTYEDLGEKEKASAIFNKILEIHRKSLEEIILIHGDTSEETIKQLKAIISVLGNMDMEIEKEEWIEKIFDIRRKNIEKNKNQFGKYDERTIESMYELRGSLYRWGKKRYKERLEINLQILEIIEELHDDSNENIVILFKDMVRLYINLEDFKNALKYGEKYLDIIRNRYEADSEEVIDAMETIAKIWYHMRNFEMEFAVYKQILELCKVKYGENHDKTVAKAKVIKDILIKRQRKNFDEALIIQEDVFNSEKQKRGEDSSKTILALWELANGFQYKGDYDKVLEILIKIVNICKQCRFSFTRENSFHKPRRNIMEMAFIKLATIYDKTMKNKDEATKIYNQIIEEYQKELDISREISDTDESYHVVSVMKKMADIFDKLNRYEDEFKMRQQIFDMLKEQEGENYEDTLEAMESLSTVFEKLDEKHKALELRKKFAIHQREIVEKLKDKFGISHRNTIRATKKLIKTLEALNYEDEVKDLRSQLSEVYKKMLNKEILKSGENSKESIFLMQKLVSVLDDEEEKIKMYQNIITSSFKYEQDTYGRLTVLPFREMNNLASYFESMQNYKEALTLRESILNYLIENGYKKGHTIILSTKSHLARDLYHIKNYDEALQIQEQLIAMFNKKFDSKNPDEKTTKIFVQLLNETIDTLNALGRPEDTQKYLNKIAELNSGNKDKNIE